MAFTWETVVQIIILILALRALHMVTATNSCSEVRRNFATRSIGPAKLVPYSAYKSRDLRVCPIGVMSCCTRDMENRFESVVKRDLLEKLETKTSSLKYNFKSFANKFQDDVSDTLSIAGNSTKDVLKKSLRKKMESDRIRIAIRELDTLFHSLGLKSTGTDVKKAFDRFADKLFVLLVDEEYNVSQPDLSYEECVARERIELHPFMDVPTISAINLTTSIEIARTLHEGLNAGAEAVDVTESTRLSKYCQAALLRMQFCSHCWGLTLIKPCHGLCKNVLRGCLAGVSELDQYWNYYVTSLVDVTERMHSTESKYNLEIALEDFENKLSSSLSIVFENITSLKNAVDIRCRNSRSLKRTKRSSAPEPDDGDLDKENKLERRQEKRGRRKGHGGRKGKNSRTSQFVLNGGFTAALKNLQEDDPYESTDEDSSTGTRSILPPHKVLLQPPNKRILRGSGGHDPKTNIVESKKPRSLLHNRVGRFIGRLNATINFFSTLPDNICEPGTLGMEVSTERSCWNGDLPEQYDKEVVPIGYGKQEANPEVKVLKVDRDIIHAINSLRHTTKMLLTASGQNEIPGILLRAPQYERRSGKTEKIPDGFTPKYPCDDEDDCEGNGSGDNKDFNPDKSPENPLPTPVVTDIEIIIGDGLTGKGRDVNEGTDDDVIIDFTVEGGNKSKCKGKKCKKGGGKKKNQPTEAPITTTSGESPSAIFSLNLITWFLSVLLGKLFIAQVTLN